MKAGHTNEDLWVLEAKFASLLELHMVLFVNSVKFTSYSDSPWIQVWVSACCMQPWALHSPVAAIDEERNGQKLQRSVTITNLWYSRLVSCSHNVNFLSLLLFWLFILWNFMLADAVNFFFFYYVSVISPAPQIFSSFFFLVCFCISAALYDLNIQKNQLAIFFSGCEKAKPP